MMLFRYKRIIFLLGILTSVSLFSFLTVAQAQAPDLNGSGGTELPDGGADGGASARPNLGSSGGTPINNGVDGGDLSPSEACSADNPLAALIPNTNPVYPDFPLFTTSANPTLLFYVPYDNEEIRYGEFTIHEYEAPHDRTKLYGGRFELPQTPGIVSLSIPKALIPYKNYRWRFKLHCSGNQTLVSTGYIRRIDSTPEFEDGIREGKPDIWYDAISTLAAKLRSSQSADDQARWNDLIDEIDSDELDTDVLAPDIIVGPVRFTGN